MLWFWLFLCFYQKFIFCCALCVTFTAFCSLSPKKTMRNPLWKRQICTKIINAIMEMNQSHNYVANSTLYNVAMKGFTLSSRIFVWIYPVCFSVKKSPSAYLINLSVSTKRPGIKSELSVVMWKFAPESKIQLVSCNMSPKYVLGMSALEVIYTIDAYILCGLLWYVLFSWVSSIFLYLYARILGFSVLQWTFFHKVSGIGEFEMKWSYYLHLKHVFGLRPLRSILSLLELQ